MQVTEVQQLREDLDRLMDLKVRRSPGSPLSSVEI